MQKNLQVELPRVSITWKFDMFNIVYTSVQNKIENRIDVLRRMSILTGKQYFYHS